MALIVGGLLAVGGAFCLGAEGPAYVVEGQVFDEAGRGLAAVPVVAVERFEHLSLPGLERPAEVREVGRTRTDAAGFYRLDLGSGPFKGRIVLRFGGGPGWDRVRYAPPEEKNITRLLRRRSRAVVNCRVGDAPGWAEVEHAIARAGGPESKRGRILRRHGMPRETLTLQNGAVEWRYPRVTYVFHGDDLVESRRRPAPRQVSRKEAP
ncbi:MAG: hypothetical protein Q9Q40_00130 [Acidobacteriota bacterium]|nr:hypothetical protein [Acidobacteriota bacterium]MDQ7088406.1 hypothetical protein [Acidobacteriota bacterium]